VWKAVNRESGNMGIYNYRQWLSKNLRREMKTNFHAKRSKDK